MVQISLQCAIVGHTGSSFDVGIDDGAKVSKLKEAIKNRSDGKIDVPWLDLQLFLAKDGKVWLDGAGAAAVEADDLKHFTLMDPTLFLRNPKHFGSGFKPDEGQVHVLVVVPKWVAEPETIGQNVERVGLPRTTALNDPEKYAEEIIALDDWGVNTVHQIPSIWEFMSSLGGCTKTGELFWRLEEKQVASLLLDGWVRESSPRSFNGLANKKSILMGSPGIGKSTLLCVMAFHVVLKYKKNVLVYRQLKEENYLFYLGYEDDEVVYFTVKRCKADRAVSIYEELGYRQGFPNVWLLLDGFRYKDIPEGLETFRMLATSQQVNLKSQELTDAYCCLLPCWSKNDLLSIGSLVYNFTHDDMKQRFFYSGGSVREFTYATWEDIQRLMDVAVIDVDDYSKLLSTTYSSYTDTSQVIRTFVENTNDPSHYLDRWYWEQTIDSEYAVLALSVRLQSVALLQIYTWAKKAGHGSLAGCAFEIYLHRLAIDNRLELYKSEYDLPELRKPNQPRNFSPKHVALKTGSAICSGNSNDFERDLVAWRDNEKFTYWYPDCDDFPNIDSIVKLEPGPGRKSSVAYLQFTIARSHAIDGNQLKKMNEIFFPDHVKNAGETDAPIYIAVCPDRESCERFILNSRPKVLAAKLECQVFVGYYIDPNFAFTADGPNNHVPIKVRKLSPYMTRKRKREQLDETEKQSEVDFISDTLGD
ncbi:hypothetical protein DVH05_003275 [Phytophthora capsici]|nr:hypothetical protein DVH05_003275 [Phytophthora capsici]